MKVMKSEPELTMGFLPERDPGEMEEIAHFRGNVYRILASIFNGPLDEELAWRIHGADFRVMIEQFATAETRQLLEEGIREPLLDLSELRYEYNNLFIVPGGQYVTPFESVYCGMRSENGKTIIGNLYGPETLAVKRLYREHGLVVSKEKIGPPDFAGTELDFMVQLIEREREYWRRTERKEAMNYLMLQKEFVLRHLARWFPPLCRNIRSNSRQSLYRALAEIAGDFIHRETETFGMMDKGEGDSS